MIQAIVRWWTNTCHCGRNKLDWHGVYECPRCDMKLHQDRFYDGTRLGKLAGRRKGMKTTHD